MTKVLAGYYQGNQHQLTSTGIHPRLVQNELLANLPFFVLDGPGAIRAFSATTIAETLTGLRGQHGK